MTAWALGILAGLSAGDLAVTLQPRGGWRRSARRPRRPRHPRHLRRPLAGVALVLLALVTPALPPLVLLGWWTARRRRAHLAERDRARAVREALPDLVDLLLLATSAGCTLAVAHPLVALHTPPPLGTALTSADSAAAAGRPRADALTVALAPLGERAHALAQVLADHLRYGVPILPALERTSLELRLDRRRQAEIDARRVPVQLLAPLVTCVLPAFALLTVVPLLAASLDGLPT